MKQHVNARFIIKRGRPLLLLLLLLKQLLILQLFITLLTQRGFIKI